MKNLKVFIITGLSGSGKSTAIAAFEDVGCYCVDNMPVMLLPEFLELPVESTFDTSVFDAAGLAFVMDLREKGFINKYLLISESLKKKGYEFKILFLEAEEETLVKRYSQTRRQHPFSRNLGLVDSIRAEKKQLQIFKKKADIILNTSNYNVHDLKSIIFDIAQKNTSIFMKVMVVSFGFKYGTPKDADLIIDVRFITNPYFITELKNLSGEDNAVKNFIMSKNETSIFLQKYLNLLDFLIPLYEKEGKSYLTIAVGCTGGRHRSVTIAQAVFQYMKETKQKVDVLHRDINR